MAEILEWLDADFEGLAACRQKLLAALDGMIGGTGIENGNGVYVRESVRKTALNDSLFVFNHKEKNNIVVLMCR
jgi:hypothetical protein